MHNTHICVSKAAKPPRYEVVLLLHLSSSLPR